MIQRDGHEFPPQAGAAFMKHSTVKNLLMICAILAAFFALPTLVFAQDQETPRFFEAQARAVDAANLVAGKTPIKLWGVQAIEGMPAQFSLKARSALENVLGSEKIRCQLKSREGDVIHAQCTNSAELDLGLYMLQQGYGVADRAAVFGSVFEDAYIQAEMTAQNQGVGVWARGSADKNSDEDTSGYMLFVGPILLLCMLAAFAVLTMTIMRGFQKVTDAQNQNMDMMSRERALRDKERQIFATMLDSEIKANKSKIEAYLVVYDEMLKDLKNLDKPPKYKTAGDIVQAQPALDRSVFDRNTDKLDILGDRLSSEVIHFYARIKNKPDYINLEPDTPESEARAIVEKAYNNAKRMDEISDRLIDMFSEGGHALAEEIEI
ncbi:MAG: hypothetical protein AAF204_01255 [Pseudomonadota bacterium]